jgi:hypothetical protein
MTPSRRHAGMKPTNGIPLNDGSRPPDCGWGRSVVRELTLSKRSEGRRPAPLGLIRLRFAPLDDVTLDTASRRVALCRRSDG